ncbi:unnamed protein product (macronuclear) [Paramecium tetraurelia]|uniref:Uncharacterized protein n=1 Tax=Paramecium tetraurelia TaxID=5888 RepID=A0E7L5_PARTE|nr:uncharacterized protein GSPATT00024010001 [Paramecium tetraurelia]CAK91282.1 unnamed protein product [Paramecium tetraurelia]|eukprot:XP_001458679.1 hypothetical protein (macronuclear) [Paramecium tetraurelia strain d4-2]
MNLKMPSIQNIHTDANSNVSQIQNDSIKRQDFSPTQISPSYLFSNNSFQPTLKIIATQKASIFGQRKETFLNSSYREISQCDIYGNLQKYKIQKQEDSLARLRGRKRSIKQHSPYTLNQQSPTSIKNIESQKKALENVIDDLKLNKIKLKKLEKSPQAKNFPVHNFYYLKNMKYIYPFQVEKSVTDLMKPFHQQRDNLLSPIQTERSLIYPQRPQIQRPQEFLDKLKNRLLKRKKTMYLPQAQIQEDPIQRKLKHFQKSIFENQCLHTIYIRPSAIRIQKYRIQDSKNESILKRCLSYRWWWQEADEADEEVQLLWSCQASSSFLSKQRTRHISDKIEFQPFEQILKICDSVEDQMKFAIEQKLCLLSPYIKIHNHIDVIDPFWTKKNLISRFQKYCTLTNQNDNDFFPFSIIVNNLGEESFYDFIRNYKTSTEIWIVLKCQNEGERIQLCENTKSVYNFIHKEYSMPSRKQQSFIVQQYIRSFVYQQIKLDLCFYLLIAQINGIVRAYLFEQFYGEQSQLNFSPLEKDMLFKSNEQFNDNYNSDKIQMKTILEYFDDCRVDYDYKILPEIKMIICEYIRSVFTQMPVKDHNFELLQVKILIDNQYKPWLIDIKPTTEFDLSTDFMKEYAQQLIDNALQLSVDVLFPSPSIWPKDKRRLIDIYSEQNDFAVVFDSRMDGQGLKSLFEEKQPESIKDDEF